MLPLDQIKEIVNLLSPDDQNQSDAVFLVQQYVLKTGDKLKAKDKQIAKLEADLEAEKGKSHRLINEKLTLINGMPRETTEVNGEREEHDTEAKHKTEGKTL